jgi:hypothetical protein
MIYIIYNMSGQPYKYASDVANYRDEYMKTLNLRTNINNMNYQANKDYLETGSLPPRSQMKDTRSTSDILLDTEKLKLSIVSDFKPIANPNMAMSIIQRVQTSPLNGDGSFFVWLAQNAPELVPLIKKKYKFGIAGNENDVATMVLFLQSLYSKTKSMNSSIKSNFDRPIATGAAGIDPRSYIELNRIFSDIYLKLISTRPLTPLLKQIKDRMDGLSQVLLPPDKYIRIRDAFLNMSNIPVNNPGYQTLLNSGGYKDWVEYNEKIPLATELSALLEQLKKSELNVNTSLTTTILKNIISILPTVEESNRIFIISQQLLAIMPGGINVPAQDAQVFTTPPVVPPAAGTPQEVGPAVAEYILTHIYNEYDDLIQTGTTNVDYDFSPNIINALDQVFPFNNNYGINYTRPIIKNVIQGYTRNNLNTVGQLINDEDVQTFVDREKPTVEALMRQSGMVGFGFKRRGRPKGSGLVKPITERIEKTKGIKQGCTQIPFGKYIINKNKLDNDIFYILDAKKGYCVKGYPQKRITKELGSVVRSIIGGSVPKFEDLQNLDNDDKEYLHRVASKAGILDKISIPSPSKDKTEKDIHEFEVMKGEILAGNDSKELIKKFKMILLRLSKNGSIPKRESVEIMEDLISLGY